MPMKVNCEERNANCVCMVLLCLFTFKLVCVVCIAFTFYGFCVFTWLPSGVIKIDNADMSNYTVEQNELQPPTGCTDRDKDVSKY